MDYDCDTVSFKHEADRAIPIDLLSDHGQVPQVPRAHDPYLVPPGTSDNSTHLAHPWSPFKQPNIVAASAALGTSPPAPSSYLPHSQLNQEPQYSPDYQQHDQQLQKLQQLLQDQQEQHLKSFQVQLQLQALESERNSQSLTIQSLQHQLKQQKVLVLLPNSDGNHKLGPDSAQIVAAAQAAIDPSISILNIVVAYAFADDPPPSPSPSPSPVVSTSTKSIALQVEAPPLPAQEDKVEVAQVQVVDVDEIQGKDVVPHSAELGEADAHESDASETDTPKPQGVARSAQVQQVNQMGVGDGQVNAQSPRKDALAGTTATWANTQSPPPTSSPAPADHSHTPPKPRPQPTIARVADPVHAFPADIVTPFRQPGDGPAPYHVTLRFIHPTVSDSDIVSLAVGTDVVKIYYAPHVSSGNAGRAATYFLNDKGQAKQFYETLLGKVCSGELQGNYGLTDAELADAMSHGCEGPIRFENNKSNMAISRSDPQTRWEKQVKEMEKMNTGKQVEQDVGGGKKCGEAKRGRVQEQKVQKRPANIYEMLPNGA